MRREKTWPWDHRGRGGGDEERVREGGNFDCPIAQALIRFRKYSRLKMLWGRGIFSRAKAAHVCTGYRISNYEAIIKVVFHSLPICYAV